MRVPEVFYGRRGLRLGLFKKESVLFDARRFIAATPNLVELARGCRTPAGYPLLGSSPDETAGNLHAWAASGLVYADDVLSWGFREHYLFPEEAFIAYAKNKGMDCEDGAHLIVSFGYCLGLQRDRLHARCAHVMVGGKTELHLYAAYRRSTDDEWVSLDWCYEPDHMQTIASRVPVRVKGNYWPTVYAYTDQECWTDREYVFRESIAKTSL